VIEQLPEPELSSELMAQLPPLPSETETVPVGVAPLPDTVTS
jgi:hypothetical protein